MTGLQLEPVSAYLCSKVMAGTLPPLLFHTSSTERAMQLLRSGLQPPSALRRRPLHLFSETYGPTTMQEGTSDTILGSTQSRLNAQCRQLVRMRARDQYLRGPDQ